MNEHAPIPGPRDLLAHAARLCPGIGEALLVDAQGMLVDRVSFAPPGADPEEIAVEAMAAVPALGRVAAGARLGRPLEWLMVGERGLLVVRRLGTLEMFLVLRVSADEFVGRARLAARILASRLADVLV